VNRTLPTVVLVVFALFLVLAGGAQAMRVNGSTLDPDPAQAAQSNALVEFGNYVVAAGAASAELNDCACCCGRLDLPTHRCAECRTAAAGMRQIVARIHRVQARLARLDVPPSAAGAHGDLVAAAEVLSVSGEYMARTVMTDPQSLVVSTRATQMPGRTRPAWRTSPQVVRSARLAAYLQAHPGPLGRGERLRALAIAWGPDPGVSGPPGDQALAYLDSWRTGVQDAAQQVGVVYSEGAFL
jgi:hypothetical protein